MSWLSNVRVAVCQFGRKHSTKILVIAGTTAVTAGTVLACRATLKAQKVIALHKERVASANEALELGSISDAEIEVTYTEQDHQLELVAIWKSTAIDLAKLYVPPVTTSILGLSCLIAAYGIVRKQNVVLLGAYKALEESVKAYRKRVAADVGEYKEDLLWRGVKHEVIEVDETQPNGKTKKVKKTVTVKDPVGGMGVYSRMYAPANYDGPGTGAWTWSDKPGANIPFLIAQLNAMQSKLTIDRSLMLHTVFDHLGLPPSPEAQIAGWLADDHPAFDNCWKCHGPVTGLKKCPKCDSAVPERGDGFVSFGPLLDSIENFSDAAIEIGLNPMQLDFNVDGAIAHVIGMPVFPETRRRS